MALVGTPVPAVIGTDYKALKKKLSKETSLPVVTVDTDGMHLFDSGEEKAYAALLRELKEKNLLIRHRMIIRPSKLPYVMKKRSLQQIVPAFLVRRRLTSIRRMGRE